MMKEVLQVLLMIFRALVAANLAFTLLAFLSPGSPEISAAKPYYLAFAIVLFVLFWAKLLWSMATSKISRNRQ
jgi:NADH:ubiquinone oxidoreductase subunit 3 (subunit A)